MIEVEKTQEGAVIRPDYDIVASRVTELRDTIMEQVDSGENKIILDLANVSVVDSMGIGVIVACLKSIKQKDGDLLVATKNQDFIKLFNVLKLDYILTRL